jgi:hypothetical protein
MSRRPGNPSTATSLIEPEEAAAEEQVAAGQTYVVESKWAGWFGGFGSEGDIARILNRRAAQGYRLVSTKSEWRLWWLLIIPCWRVKLLFFFERAQ